MKRVPLVPALVVISFLCCALYLARTLGAVPEILAARWVEPSCFGLAVGFVGAWAAFAIFHPHQQPSSGDPS